MESAELVDMMINGASPSEMQDAVKDLLIMKAADKVDEFKPSVANSLFGAITSTTTHKGYAGSSKVSCILNSTSAVHTLP